MLLFVVEDYLHVAVKLVKYALHYNMDESKNNVQMKSTVNIVKNANWQESRTVNFKSIQKFGFINRVDNVNWPPYRDSKS